MANELTNHTDKPLDQLLAELTDAKLEKREEDIEQLQEEISQRQARGERPPELRPDDNAPKAL